MLAIHLPTSPIEPPRGPATYSSPIIPPQNDFYTPLALGPPPKPRKSLGGARPKLSLTITADTRRTFSKSSSSSMMMPPASAGPLSPTSLTTIKNTQFNARRDANITIQAPTTPRFTLSVIAQPDAQPAKRTRRVCFAEAPVVIGYSVREEDYVSSSSESEDSTDDSSSEDESSPVNNTVMAQMEELKALRSQVDSLEKMPEMEERQKGRWMWESEKEEDKRSSSNVGFGFGAGISRFSR